MKNRTLIITLTAVLIVVLAGFGYLLSSNILKSDMPVERSINKLEQMSDSTEETDLESDLTNSDFSDLDKEIEDIDTELNSTE